MEGCCDDWKKRVESLEGEVAELWATIRKIHEENQITVQTMTKTIQAAEGFRDRVFAVLEKQTGKTIQ